jgi:hypothetical protein
LGKITRTLWSVSKFATMDTIALFHTIESLQL